MSNRYKMVLFLFKLIWKASPLLLLILLLITVLMGLLPIASISTGSLLLNSIVTHLPGSQHVTGNPSNVLVLALLLGGVFLLSQLTSQSQNIVSTLYQTKLVNIIQHRIAEQA